MMISPSSGRFLVTARKSGYSSMAFLFRALPGFFRSSQGKVEQDEKKFPVASPYTPFWLWRGPWWGMRGQYAKIRKEYPKIPVYKVDRSTFMRKLAGRTEVDRLLLDIMRSRPFWHTRAMMVKGELKGPKIVRKTILVVGGDVEELEAAAERINKKQQ